MRIALVLRGHYRSFDKVEESWIKSLEGCNYTCFFHTWNTIDSTTKSWCKDPEKSIELSNDKIIKLKNWDPKLEIELQEYSQEEINDIYATATFKSYYYKYLSLKKTLNRINKDDFDIIIVGRYDLILNNISFKNININKNEILIGARDDNRFLHNLATSDALFAFNALDKDKFNEAPIDFNERKFKYSEECYVDFFYKNFNIVNHIWKQQKDFDIQR